MRRPACAALPFAVAVLAASAIPARAERLVTSLSDYQVMITSNFLGQNLVLFGGIESDGAAQPQRSGYDIVATVTGPPQSLLTFRKRRALGIWVNAEPHEFPNTPAYLAFLSNRPLTAIVNHETLLRLQLGLENYPLPEGASAGTSENSAEPFRVALIRLRREQGLYREESNAVTFLTPRLFRAFIPLPADVPVGSYVADVRLFADGAQIARAPAPFEVAKYGVEQVVTAAAREHGVLYGLAVVAMALLTGWFASVVFRRD
jgi:uncharacterized protein (TIGR02186 family)